MHDVAVRAVVVVIRAIEINAPVEFDTRRVGCVTMGNDRVVRQYRTHGKCYQHHKNKNRNEGSSTHDKCWVSTATIDVELRLRQFHRDRTYRLSSDCI